MDLKLNVEVICYPQDFKNPLNIKKINQELSDELTKQAKEITNTLLQANCDALGIGRQISAFTLNYGIKSIGTKNIKMFNLNRK
ncbi:hypothetical protein COE25_10330 [Bacillus sp. AFS031507]|nr:hypothetical protein COE25_10330 [Bacillus sp. AFS031507]